MFKIAICDNEISVVSNIERMLEELSFPLETKLDIDVFYDGSQLIHHIKNEERYDIIYLALDKKIFKRHQTSITNIIKEIDKKTLIIYLVNHINITKEVFEILPFRVITKPINRQEFQDCFMDAQNALLNDPQYLCYKYKKTFHRIPIDEIMYLESDRRVTHIITKKKDLAQERKYYEKLNVIEQKLMENEIYFYRIHQSFLVNPKYVISYSQDMMELEGGTKLTISEKRRKYINRVYSKLKRRDIVI